jgi:capsular exopolysaccharide synthesis family protein
LEPIGQENTQSFSQLLSRLWPYLPVILITLALGIGLSYYYLRTATRFFAAHAQIVVNDNSLKEDNNLNVSTPQQNQNNELSEVEKQIEIIKSNGLLTDVVKKLNLHIQWSEDEKFKAQNLLSKSPASIELLSPDSIVTETEGPVKIIASQNSIEFNGKIYPADTVVSSPLGMIRWKINDNKDNRVLYLKVLPLSDMADMLDGRISVTQLSKQSTILELSIIDEIPARAINILNTVIDVYGESNLFDKKKLLEKSLSFIDERLLLVSQDLRSVEVNLQNYKSSGGITDLASEGQIYLGQVKDNDQKLSEIDVQLNVLRDVEEYLSKRNQSANAAPATLGLSDQVLVTLLSSLFQDEFDLERLEKVSGEKNEQATILRDRIEKRKNSILISIVNLKRSLESSRQALLSNNNNFTRSLRSIPVKERTLLNITRDQSIKNDLYTFLLRKREETAIAAAATASNYRVIEKPANYGLVKPKPMMIYIYGVLGALLVSGLWVYRKEFANTRVLYRSEIANKTAIPIIGEIIFEHTSKENEIEIGQQSRTLIAEQFRELRANINYNLRAERNSKVIMVTSSVPGEGKSFLSINLAVSFAFSGKKTLLVEFDLYRPKVCEGLGVKYEKGITDYFQGHANTREICHRYSAVENLWVVAAGTSLANPAELILNGKLPALMQHLKKEFEYIIIDTPCIGMVSDTKILAPYANLSLYIIRQKHTHHHFLKFVNELNTTGEIPNMHLVFNGVKIKKAPGLNYWDSYGHNGYRYGNENPYTHADNKKHNGKNGKNGKHSDGAGFWKKKTL